MKHRILNLNVEADLFRNLVEELLQSGKWRLYELATRVRFIPLMLEVNRVFDALFH
jgi:hypothetical protein